MNINKFESIKRILLENLNPNEFSWVKDIGTVFSHPAVSNSEIGLQLIDAYIFIKGWYKGDVLYSITSKITEVVFDTGDQVLALKLSDGTLLFSPDGIAYCESNEEYCYGDIDVNNIKIYTPDK